MSKGIRGVRGRGLRLAVAGVVATSVGLGGAAMAGASPAATPAAPAAAPVAAAAPALVPTAVDIAVAPGDEVTRLMPPTHPAQYDVYYKIATTARYPQTVFSEVTNEGRFNQIFPIAGAKANLGQVGTKHNLHVLKVPFPVTVASLGKTTWRFNTRKGHPDYPGTVQFWLYKKGNVLKLHVQGKCALCGETPYIAIAYAQWRKFAKNIDAKVDL